MRRLDSEGPFSVREQVNEIMMELLGQKPAPNLYVSQNICLEDIRRDEHLLPFLAQGKLLKELVGRTIRAVRWDDEITVDNPHGFGRFIVEVEPK